MILLALETIDEMWLAHERLHVKRRPRYLNEETLSIGEFEIVRGGNVAK